MNQRTTNLNTRSNRAGGAAVGGAVAAIIAAVFALEGGYVNNPRDPGGATNHGITERVARSAGYQGHMRDLPKETAQDIYYEQYVKQPNYHLMVDVQPALAEKLVDAGVNTGPSRSSRWFQTALNALNRDGKDYPDIAVDGRIGPTTVGAYRSLVRVRGEVKSCEMVLKLMDTQQGMHYLNLRHMETFMVGWVDHRLGNVPLSKCKNYMEEGR